MTAPRGSAEDLQISAPDPGTDGPKLIDLLCKTFAVSAGYWQGERIKQGKIELLTGSRSENSISGGEAIAQLMFGTDDPQETIDSGGIRLRGQAKFLVPVLFPNEYPALSFWDRF